MEIFLDKGTIELVAVASEFCSFVEKAGNYGKDEFIGKLSKMLALAYLKASLAEPDGECDSLCEEGCSMAFLSEYEYEYVRGRVSQNLGGSDRYIGIFDSGSAQDDCEQAEISLCIADIYHSLKNFAENFRSGSEESAKASLSELISDFRDFWGYRCLSAMAALHAIMYSGSDMAYDDAQARSAGSPGGGFLDRFLSTKR